MGVVRDGESGSGIAGVVIRSVDVDGIMVLTDAQGRFRIVGLAMGIHEIVLTHLAYGETSHLVNVLPGGFVEFDVTLRQSAIALDPLVAEVEVRVPTLTRVGFYERAWRGLGTHFHGEDVERLQMEQLLLQVPGVQVQQMGSSASDRRVTFRRPTHSCTPEIYLDGFRLSWAEGSLRDATAGVKVVAVEVYRGNVTPPQFQRSGDTGLCGAIVLWSDRE